MHHSMLLDHTVELLLQFLSPLYMKLLILIEKHLWIKKKSVCVCVYVCISLSLYIFANLSSLPHFILLHFFCFSFVLPSVLVLLL